MMKYILLGYFSITALGLLIHSEYILYFKTIIYTSLLFVLYKIIRIFIKQIKTYINK